MAELKAEESFETPAVVVGQKRGNSDNGGPVTKKPNVGDPEVQVKVLIPAPAVGALIGKGGESMRALKTDSGCRVQMSKNQELFQNTNERICMVKGKVTSAMVVMKAILEKIQEKIEPTGNGDQFDLKGLDRKFEMKVVVPNTSAGMVIGKSGASIKEIRENTGANIQVYPKAGSEEAKQSVERVITVGSDNNIVLLDAVQRVLEKVAADPLHAQDPAKTEFAAPNSSFSSFSQRPDSSAQFSSMGFGSTNSVWQSQTSIASNESNYKAPSNFQSVQIKYNGMPVLNNSEVISFLDNLQNTLRTSGFNEAAVAEIMQAMHVLARYNIMGLGLGLGVATMAHCRSNDMPNPSQMLQQPPQPVQSMGTQRYDLTQPMMAPPTNGISSLMEGNDRQENSIGKSGVLIDVLSQRSPPPESFATSVIKVRKNEDGVMELEVPNAIAGAVIGPRAKTLAELQHLSGCKVEVYKPGEGDTTTGHRLISITGDVNAIGYCRDLVERTINAEQARRQPSGPYIFGTRSG